MVAVNGRSVSPQIVDASPTLAKRAKLSLHTRARRWTSSPESAFTLVELLIVVTVIGILAAIATPMFLAARQSAVEKAVVANLRTMAANQQIFFLNPVPLPPSGSNDGGKRYARLHELNAYSSNAFGHTTDTFYVDGPSVRYSMVPLWPSTASLRGQFVVQACQQDVPGGFIYEVDESGRIVKIR
jgi:prepilin-type N-terminal cleavage/methylation domain-containing protein